MTDRHRRGAAYHEAGHAVVAAMLDCRVNYIDISEADGLEGAAGMALALKGELSVRDRAAIIWAGKVAQELFEAPTHSRAHFGDQVSFDLLLEGLDLDEAVTNKIKSAGEELAREILRKQEPSVHRVAEYLMRHDEMDGKKFASRFAGQTG